MNLEFLEYNQPKHSIVGLQTESQKASTAGSVTGLVTLGGAAAASLIPAIGPILAVGIGTVGAATTAYQLIKKQRADRKISHIVQEVQTTLKKKEIYTGSIDGVLGSELSQAVKRVQQQFDNLKATGLLDDETVDAIVDSQSSLLSDS